MFVRNISSKMNSPNPVSKGQNLGIRDQLVRSMHRHFLSAF